MQQIIEIKDFSDERLDVYARLSENQLYHINEPEPGMFIAESPKVIERALDAGYLPVSLLTERKHIEGEAAGIISRLGDVPVFTSDPEILTRLTGFNLTRGALCAMRRNTLPDFRDICAGRKRIALFDNINNPTNIGAAFRSAAALGVDAVLLTDGCSDPLYRRAARVSMGTVFQVPWTYIDNKNGNGIKMLKCEGFASAAMALDDNSVSIDDKALNNEEKLVIVLGNEGIGLSDAVINECDYTVMIPMSHGVDSLNVAAASAVAFWQLCRNNIR